VDDNKISHVDAHVAMQIIEAIESHFEKMTVTRGHKHTFLGMDLVFNDDGTVKISMSEYVKDAINVFGGGHVERGDHPSSARHF